MFVCGNVGIPAFAVKLKRSYYIQRPFCLRRGTFVGRKYPKASAFLKESSQRTKNIFPCCPSPVSLSRRCSEFSMVVLPRLRRPACAFAPRTPCFILLAPFYQRIHLAGIRRRRLKSEDRINSRRNRSGGSWVKVFLFFSWAFLFSLLLSSFLFSRKEKRKKRNVTPGSPAFLWSS